MDMPDDDEDTRPWNAEHFRKWAKFAGSSSTAGRKASPFDQTTALTGKKIAFANPLRTGAAGCYVPLPTSGHSGISRLVIGRHIRATLPPHPVRARRQPGMAADHHRRIARTVERAKRTLEKPGAPGCGAVCFSLLIHLQSPQSRPPDRSREATAVHAS